MRVNLLFVVIFQLLSVSVAHSAAPDRDSPFGIVCPWDGLKQTGIGWVRCGAGATALGNWCGIEKQKGTYTWERSDTELQAVLAQGLTPLPVLGYTPSWASSGSKREASAPPKNLQDYARFVDNIVTRYAGSISCWEIWNEPDIGFWTGTISGYVDLLKAAYTAAKTADPSCKVVFGGTAGVNLPFIERVYEFGGRDYFDVMAVHPYQWGDSFDDSWFTSQLVDLRRLMNSKGDSHKEIWLTEMGWSTGDKGISEEVQAKLLTQAMVTALTLRNMGVTRTFWFCVKDWGGPGHGILRDDGSKKPAYSAYATLTKVLKGAQYVGRLPLGEGVKCHVFRRSTGAVILVVWAGEKTRVKIPASSGVSQVEYLNYLGEKVELRRVDDEYLVWAQPEPLYIVRADTSVFKKVEKPALPPFTPQLVPSVRPPVVWASIVAPDYTSRPHLAFGAASKLSVRIYNQGDLPAGGKLYLNLEGLPRPKPLDYRVDKAGSKIVTFTINVPSKGRTGLVEASLGGSANGEKLRPTKSVIRVCGGRVIEFLANSTTESRYLFRNDGSGCAPSVRFGGTWTYRFDLSKAKFARVDLNVGAHQAAEWRVLASSDNQDWKTVLSGKSERAWHSVRLDEYAGKSLYFKFEGSDQQLGELILYSY